MNINIRSFILRLLVVGVIATGILGIVVLFLLSPTAPYVGKRVHVEEGATLSEVAKALKEEGVVRSATLFQSLVLFKGGERGVVAGEYRFLESQSAHEVAERLLEGDYGIELYTVTVPEGITSYQTAALLAQRIPNFNEEAFARLASTHEGFLFPATYTFPADVTPEKVVEVMRETFEERVEELADELQDEATLYETLKLASIIEEEAVTDDSKRIVSGILQKRLDDDMPLQVDAAFLYVDSLTHKTSATLTMDDLAIDSPYNTYTQKGLPPTPISNPGISSIRAALDPLETEYYFYLNDLRGNMYYAADFEGHKENRRYLEI